MNDKIECSSRRLLNFEFVSMCLITFLASCNLTVYYNLFTYLHSLNIPVEQRGMVIGIYSLSAMSFYLLASPFLNANNSFRIMLRGMFIIVVSGCGYFFFSSLPGLLFLRILNGVGQFCIGAGAMTLAVIRNQL